ncbi:cephalosporin hydroxylase family protein [Thiorhodococcus minor]|uniref:Cephalosporin hydroxylase n=1 Tax=Thiorhodococcus minor TaxID=57489 RepID=A0A6M0JTW2_9GAMM|nr:cephalosporin hydroxylase family protein [Thiorhodococcus minor]NEV60554.1 cephalosporin hydroxylase [Thiorhodococcus minor]
MTDDRAIFLSEREERLEHYRRDRALQDSARSFLGETLRARYSYQFDWLGLPIIQYPQDMAALQEIIWSTRPDLIIETGIARGGSLVFSASMLALLDLADAAAEGRVLDPRRPGRTVLGVDIDIRPHNRVAIEAHPLSARIRMIEGSSIADDVVARARELAAEHARVMVCLDSSHTHDHVMAELMAYAPLVGVGAYCVVLDTVIEDLPEATFPGRPWGRGNSPKSAVHAFLADHPEFEIDTSIPDKLLSTVAPDGYLRRLS